MEEKNISIYPKPKKGRKEKREKGKKKGRKGSASGDE